MTHWPTAFSKMIKYLNKYEKMWQVIAANNPPYPCLNMMNSDMNSSNYNGYNFSGTGKAYCLFNSDLQVNVKLGLKSVNLSVTPTYFSAICHLRDKTRADLCPIFLINTTTNNTKYVGNFRFYIRKLIRHCLLLNKNSITMPIISGYNIDKFLMELKEANKGLNKFSDEVNYRKYKLVKN